jgi:hypothetical protein
VPQELDRPGGDDREASRVPPQFGERLDQPGYRVHLLGIVGDRRQHTVEVEEETYVRCAFSGRGECGLPVDHNGKR